jgi:hypothetical protein
MLKSIIFILTIFSQFCFCWVWKELFDWWYRLLPTRQNVPIIERRVQLTFTLPYNMFVCECVWVSKYENVSPVCRGLTLYRLLFAPLDRWVVSVVIFGTRYYDILCRACVFMARYVMHEHSWRVMSRMSIYDALFWDWAVVTDKRNFELAEAPEFSLWAYSSPLGGVE